MEVNEQQSVIVQGVDHTAFWQRMIQKRNDGLSVIENGQHYRIGAHIVTSNNSLKGFGGHRWIVRFYDGHAVRTDNLWHQGAIPAEFRDQLPDNAILEADEPPPLLVSLLSDDVPF